MGQALLEYCFVLSVAPGKSVEINTDMITLTERARDYLKSISEGGYVSLGVKGGGCNGFQYVWDHAKNWPDVKWSDPIDDVLVVDPMAELYIVGSTIDYVEELGASFLSIKNPMQTSSCGCGESFSV